MKKIFSGLFGLIFMLFAGCSTGETILYVQSTTEDATVVKYYKQTLSDRYDFADQENINLKAGTKLSDITKKYEHYVAKGFSQNGKVLSVFFDRETYTLTFKADGKVFKTISGIYESNVSLTGLGEPYSLTRHFNRWLGEDGNDAVFPTTFTENITYNAEMHDGVQITINNRNIDQAEFAENVLLKPHKDSLNEYREEYNEMLKHKMAEGHNNMRREKYITLSISAESYFFFKFSIVS